MRNVENVQKRKSDYDLEERTFLFAKETRDFLKNLSRTFAVIEDGKQLIRSSWSVGANYIEANESLSKKDFLMRIKISRKEAKESLFWLRLINVEGESLIIQRQKLMQEAKELQLIFGSILRKSE